MKNKNKIILIIIIISIVLLGIIFGIVDYNRTQKKQRPLFAIKTLIYKDGGSVEYLGLGYKIIKYNKMDSYDYICEYEYRHNIGNLDGYLDELPDCIIEGRKDTVFGFWTLKYK